jgi:FMN phosphatase YigB (HAD superfamily)
MTEAVIFDLYGTLIRPDRDTSPYLRFARLVRPDDPRAVVLRSLLSDTRGIADFAVRPGFSPPSDIGSLDEDLRRDLRSAHAFEGAAETPAGLRGRGLKPGLISDLAAPYKEPFYRHGLATYFDATLSSCDVGLRKPEPEVYLRMARELGICPASAVMVGDSRRSDDDGARAVGMEAILLRRSGEGRGNRVIKSLRDLPGEIRL